MEKKDLIIKIKEVRSHVDFWYMKEDILKALGDKSKKDDK